MYNNTPEEQKLRRNHEKELRELRHRQRMNLRDDERAELEWLEDQSEGLYDYHLNNR